MNAKLEERCKRQLENEKSIRQLSTVDSEESVKLGSLLYTAIGVTEDDEKIAQCRKILQEKTAFFSNIRGVLQSLLLLKMALAEDPEAYIDGIITTHDKLTEEIVMSGLFSVLTSVIIYDEHGDKDIDAVVKRVVEMFEDVKRTNPALSFDNDMAYIALMLLSGKADTKIEEEKNIIFKALKEKFHMTADAAHAATLVLITSSKSTEEKIDAFCKLYDALKANGHATSTKRSISIYGAFTDLNVPTEELAQVISELDQFLKGQRGYGALSISSDFRKVMASTLALQYYTIDVPAEQAASNATTASGISVEALLFIVLMSIVAIG